MARIPQDFIDDLISRADIVEVIDARVPLKKHGREFTACCPFHTEKTPSFTVSPTKQFFHCFGCGVHGTVLGFLMDYEHLEFVEAVRRLAAVVGMELPTEAGEARPDFGPLYAILDRAARFYRDALRNTPEAIAYLKHRGLTGAIAAEFGMGFAPTGWDTLLKALGTSAAECQMLSTAGCVIPKDGGGYYDRFRERIMFPIRDRVGRVIAFGGRVLDQTEPKYLNSPETALFHKGRELYGLYEARQASREIPRLLVVEGYMDVVALHQHGLRYAVATLGTATTSEQLQRIFRVTQEVVFCFDGDRAGRNAAWRALEVALPEVRDGRQVRFLFLPEGEDPDTLVRKVGKTTFEPRLNEALPLSRVLLDRLASQADLSSLDGRARLVELARPYLARIPAGVYRDMLVATLAQLAQIDSEKLTMLNRTPPRRGGKGDTRLVDTPVLPHGPIRKAIILLLSRPALGLLAGDPGALEGLNLKGAKVLRTLLEFARAHPHISGAGLLEHWRDTEIGSSLMTLARLEQVTPLEAMETEFQAVMTDLLGRRPAEQRLAALLEASRTRRLEADEKAELSGLLKVHPTRRSDPQP